MTSDDDDLAALMLRAQDGDADAYRALLEATGAWLAQYFRGRVPDHALDDLVQETLMSVHRKRASFQPGRPYLPWLATIARYRWVDAMRRSYRSRAEELRSEPAVECGHDGLVARLSLESLLARLPLGQQRAIQAVKIDGYSVAEAARMLGQTESLVKVNIHRGLKRLAAAVDRV